MNQFCQHPFIVIALFWATAFGGKANAQSDLFVNNRFADINICTEYASACGMEGWFYMDKVNVQIIPIDSSSQRLEMVYSTEESTVFNPLIGTLLPCSLIPGNSYIFSADVQLKHNPKWVVYPAICFGEFYYFPYRPFSKNLEIDTPKVTLSADGKTMHLNHEFVAKKGLEYFTLGFVMETDTLADKRFKTAKEPIYYSLSNVTLLPLLDTELPCTNKKKNADAIYNYNYRHRIQSNSLYAKGRLIGIEIDRRDSSNKMRIDTNTFFKKIQRIDTLVLSDVLFDFDNYSLGTKAKKIINKYREKLKNVTLDSLVIKGHTDDKGSAEYNFNLSKKRSEIVKKFFVEQSEISGDLIFCYAMGETSKKVDNNSEENRAINRRVEVYIFYRER